MSKITKVIARQVYDSRGNPTIEAEVFANNMRARAICPSGASTGSHEAYEKRDISNKKYLGKSVLKAVDLVNKKISKKLKNQNVHNQEKIDSILINLDGTKQKTKIGANTILAVSMAAKKLSSKIKKIGNSSLEGATLMLKSTNLRSRIEELVKNVSHIELETTPDFFDIFVEGCMFKEMPKEIS